MRHVLIALVICCQSLMSFQAAAHSYTDDVVIDPALVRSGQRTHTPVVVGRTSTNHKPTRTAVPGAAVPEIPVEADGDGIPDSDEALEGGPSCPDNGHAPISAGPVDNGFIDRVGYCPSTSRNDLVNFCGCVARTGAQGQAGFHAITKEEVIETSPKLAEIIIAEKIRQFSENYNKSYDELLFALGEPTMRPEALRLRDSDCFPGRNPNALASYFNNLSNPGGTCSNSDSKQTINKVFFGYGRDQSHYTSFDSATSFRPTAGNNFIQHLETISQRRYHTITGHLQNGLNLTSTDPNVLATCEGGTNCGQIATISQTLLSSIRKFSDSPAEFPAEGSEEYRQVATALLSIPLFGLQDQRISPEQMPGKIQQIFRDIYANSGASGPAYLTQDQIKTAIQRQVESSLTNITRRCDEMKDLLNDMCELASITRMSETSNQFNPFPLRDNTSFARDYAQAQSRMRSLREDGTASIGTDIDPLSMAATPAMVDDYQNFLFRIDAWTCINSPEIETFEGAYTAEAHALMITVHQQNDKAEPLAGDPSSNGLPGGNPGIQGGQSRDNFFNNLATQQSEQIENIRRSGGTVRDSQQSDEREVAESVEVPLPESDNTQGTSAIPFAPVAAAPKSSSVDFLPELGGASDGESKATTEVPLVAKGAGTSVVPDATAELRRQIEEMRASITRRQQQLEAMMQERNRQAQTGTDTSEIDALMDRRRQELLDLDRQLQAKRTQLATATPVSAPVAERAPAALVDAGGGSAAVGSSSAKAPRSGGSSSSGSIASSGGAGTAGFGLNSSGASVSATGTGLASLGVDSNYSGPQLFLNGQKFDSAGKFIIDFTRLATATPTALKEIFKLSDGQPIYVRFEDNSLREYVPQAIDNGEVVFIPRDDSANRSVAAKGEIEVAPVGEEGSETRVKHSDLVEILDTNVERE